ncbi:hypothetical protein ONS95_007211 [Cadophora gregata]|uniref:uncharacterized protein n=1 Tax=Cadophora gregata TaxID=51156 RepID=UPI0026DD8566|nr:uncharacterized protein ONS95_007211 [Cadophora gregata]KAK0100763.1 hypothetical protein ONS95_007211 [Cadophora gregata]KAK0117244.1 hypothetical protein ONS96_013077 [Cadophora gregata f. sp. sojae]
MTPPAPTTSTNSPSPALTATYSSPTNKPFTHSTSLPSLQLSESSNSSPATAQKTQYLAALRQATSQMQEVINKELTARMEEDNARAATAVGENGDGKAKLKGVDENKEEENYGEEVVEED